MKGRITKPPAGIKLNRNHPLAQGLVGYWALNEGSGTMANDLSGNNNTGTLVNFAMPPTATSGWSGSSFGTAIRFDGSNDIVQIADAPSLQNSYITLMSQFSISTDTGNYQALIHKSTTSGDASYAYRLLYNKATSTLLCQMVISGTQRSISATANLALETVHMAAATYDGKNIRLYLDGQSVATPANFTSVVSSSVGGVVKLGRSFSTNFPLSGRELFSAIWNRPLNDYEILKMYMKPYDIFRKKNTIFLTGDAGPVPTVTPPFVYNAQIAGDKTLVLNTTSGTSMANVTSGVKIFPVYIYAMCHPTFTTSAQCDPSKNTNFMMSARIYTIANPEQVAEITGFTPKLEANSIYWVADARQAPSIMPAGYNSMSHFLGYYQIDEPDGSSAGQTTADLQSYYNAVKAFDPNHIVILNNFQNANTWYPYCDVFTWDKYTITSNAAYTRAQAIYEYELRTNNLVFNAISIDSIPKPVWAVIQANGIVTPILAYVPTNQEAKANTYSAVCMNVKGIGFWSYYNNGGALPLGYGLAANTSLWNYYKQLATELRQLNNVLVLPSRAYFWFGHADTTGYITVNPNPTTTVETFTIHAFSYMLKLDNSTSPYTYYLFIVNKDSSPMANITITIPAITGTTTATTIGLETSGSQAAGRTLAVTNGAFTDSFDGYAVHIYQIPASS